MKGFFGFGKKKDDRKKPVPQYEPIRSSLKAGVASISSMTDFCSDSKPIGNQEFFENHFKREFVMDKTRISVRTGTIIEGHDPTTNFEISVSKNDMVEIIERRNDIPWTLVRNPMEDPFGKNYQGFVPSCIVVEIAYKPRTEVLKILSSRKSPVKGVTRSRGVTLQKLDLVENQFTNDSVSVKNLPKIQSSEQSATTTTKHDGNQNDNVNINNNNDNNNNSRQYNSDNNNNNNNNNSNGITKLETESQQLSSNDHAITKKIEIIQNEVNQLKGKISEIASANNQNTSTSAKLTKDIESINESFQNHQRLFENLENTMTKQQNNTQNVTNPNASDSSTALVNLEALVKNQAQRIDHLESQLNSVVKDRDIQFQKFEAIIQELTSRINSFVGKFTNSPLLPTPSTLPDSDNLQVSGTKVDESQEKSNILSSVSKTGEELKNEGMEQENGQQKKQQPTEQQQQQQQEEVKEEVKEPAEQQKEAKQQEKPQKEAKEIHREEVVTEEIVTEENESNATQKKQNEEQLKDTEEEETKEKAKIVDELKIIEDIERKSPPLASVKKPSRRGRKPPSKKPLEKIQDIEKQSQQDSIQNITHESVAEKLPPPSERKHERQKSFGRGMALPGMGMPGMMGPSLGELKQRFSFKKQNSSQPDENKDGSGSAETTDGTTEAEPAKKKFIPKGMPGMPGMGAMGMNSELLNKFKNKK